ncbi:hypothetical protein BT69DRAFT_1297399 [Atractiella rhizophila]|nr:hypothetical protein BT69DRAFT_1297399 [Atractiella rhizophila]
MMIPTRPNAFRLASSFRSLSTATHAPRHPRPARETARTRRHHKVDPSILSTIQSSPSSTPVTRRKRKSSGTAKPQTEDEKLRHAIDLYHNLQLSIPFNDEKLMSASIDRLVFNEGARPVPMLHEEIEGVFGEAVSESLAFDKKGMRSISRDDQAYNKDGAHLHLMPPTHPRANWNRTAHRLRVMYDALHGTSAAGRAGLEVVREFDGEKAGKMEEAKLESERRREEREVMEKRREVEERAKEAEMKMRQREDEERMEEEAEAERKALELERELEEGFEELDLEKDDKK